MINQPLNQIMGEILAVVKQKGNILLLVTLEPDGKKVYKISLEADNHDIQPGDGFIFNSIDNSFFWISKAKSKFNRFLPVDKNVKQLEEYKAPTKR